MRMSAGCCYEAEEHITNNCLPSFECRIGFKIIFVTYPINNHIHLDFWSTVDTGGFTFVFNTSWNQRWVFLKIIFRILRNNIKEVQSNFLNFDDSSLARLLICTSGWKSLSVSFISISLSQWNRIRNKHYNFYCVIISWIMINLCINMY